MNESYFENLLRIDTSKFEYSGNGSFETSYEPTPYNSIIKLFKKYTPLENPHFVDFGSGKGRFSFIVNYFFDVGCTGVEVRTEYHKKCLENLASYGEKYTEKAKKIFFVNSSAEKYAISSFENVFYFYNPFSVKFFSKVVGNILESVKEHERTVDIILYFPTDEFTYFLDRKTPFYHFLEVYPEGKYSNPMDKFVVYRYGKTTEVLTIEMQTTCKSCVEICSCK